MEPTELLERAAREITDRFRRKNGIPSEMEGAVLFSSRQIAQNAYQTARQMKRDTPRTAPTINLPKIPDGLRAEMSARIKEADRQLVEEDRQRGIRYLEALVRMTRDLAADLFQRVGVTEKTADELVEFIYSQQD